jgi:cytochrome P450
MNALAVPLPDHVPPELAYPFALTPRKVVHLNPYTDIIPGLHRGPAIFYGTDIFPGPGGGGWVIRRAEDLKSVYDNTIDFVKKGNGQFASMVGESWDVIPTELDPPRHTAFRKALNPVFSPKNMNALDSLVTERAQSYIAKFKDRGAVEFVKEFAIPFPVSIFLDLLGLPQGRMDQFLEWEFSLLHTNDLGLRVAAIRAVKALLLDEIKKRRSNPGEDLISNACRMQIDGRPWSDEEVFGHCFNLFLGGLDTVSANVGLHFYHLATHPDHQRELRGDPSKLEIGMSELLRAYAAVTTLRICFKEIKIHGITIKPGDRVAMPTPLGSNDPEAFEAPTEVRLDRRPAHLTFGYGPHRCLGAHLARRELQISITEMFRAIPEFKLKPGFDVPFFLSNIIHVDELPLVW